MKKVFIPAIAALLLIPSLFLSGCGGNAEWREVKTSVLPQLMEGNLKESHRSLPLVRTSRLRPRRELRNAEPVVP